MNFSHDLIHCILDHVESFDPLTRRDTLAALALTSKAWLSTATGRLYRAPHLPTNTLTLQKAESLLATLAANSTLAARVTSLAIGAWTTRLLGDDLHQRNSNDIELARREAISAWTLAILSACPNIKRLDFPRIIRRDAAALEAVLSSLGQVEELLLADAIVADTRLGMFPGGKHHEISTRAAWSTADMARIITRWPSNLRTIELRAFLLDIPHPTPISVPCSLESFTLHFQDNGRDCILGLTLEEVHQWLGGSRHSLRHLNVFGEQIVTSDAFDWSFRSYHNEDGLEQLLKSHGSNLTSLNIITPYHPTFTSLPLSLPSTCPLLTTLRLSSLFPQSTFLQGLESLAQLAHLRHLTLAAVDYRVRTPTRGTYGLVEPEAVGTALEAFPTLEWVQLGSEVDRLRDAMQADALAEGKSTLWSRADGEGLVARMSESGVCLEWFGYV